MNEIKFPTTKQDSPLPNDFKIFQQIEPVEIIFMKLLVVYLRCTWTVTLFLARWRLLLSNVILYSPLSDLCNAKIVISARVALMFSWMRPFKHFLEPQRRGLGQIYPQWGGRQCCQWTERQHRQRLHQGCTATQRWCYYLPKHRTDIVDLL